MVIIRCDIRHALIHWEIVRNKFMTPEGIIGEGSSSHISSHLCEQNFVRIEESQSELLPAWVGSGYLPSEQGQTYLEYGSSQRGKLPFGPTSWEMGQRWLGQKRAVGYQQTRPLNWQHRVICIPWRSWMAAQLCRSHGAKNFWGLVVYRAKATWKIKSRQKEVCAFFSPPCDTFRGLIWMPAVFWDFSSYDFRRNKLKLQKTGLRAFFSLKPYCCFIYLVFSLFPPIILSGLIGPENKTSENTSGNLIYVWLALGYITCKLKYINNI